MISWKVVLNGKLTLFSSVYLEICKVHFGLDILPREFYGKFGRGMVLACQSPAIFKAVLYNQDSPLEMLSVLQ